MKVVYVAGPFRSANAWGVAQNVRRAETVAFEVWSLGAAALCPHTNTANFDGTLTDEAWIEGTKELLRRCDAVLLVEGWERSSGSVGEVMEARGRGMPVFERLDELRAWLRREGSR